MNINVSPDDAAAAMSGTLGGGAEDHHLPYANYRPSMLRGQTYTGTLEFRLTMEEWHAEMARRQRDFPPGHSMRRNPFHNYNQNMPPSPHQQYRDAGGMNMGIMDPIRPPSEWDAFRTQHTRPMWGIDDHDHLHMRGGTMDPNTSRDRRSDWEAIRDTHIPPNFSRTDNMWGMGPNDHLLLNNNNNNMPHQHYRDAGGMENTGLMRGGIMPQNFPRGRRGIATSYMEVPRVVSTGGYQTAWVVDATQVRGEMLCCICGTIMYNPLTLGSCGHGCCGRCLNDVETGRPRSECPQCNTPIRSLNFNSAISTEIGGLAAKCPRCPFTGTLSEVHGHQRSCTAPPPAPPTSTSGSTTITHVGCNTTTTTTATTNPVSGGISDSDRAIAWLQGHVPSSAPPVPVTPEMRAAATRVALSPEVVEWFATVLGQARLDALPPPHVDAASHQPTASSTN